MHKKLKQFVILGMGKFGQSLATTLTEGGHDVLVIDKNEDYIDEFANIVTQAVQADFTDKDILKTLGISNFDFGIVAVSKDLESSILATVLLKEMGVGYVIAKAQNMTHKNILEKIGADKVVFPEQEMGERLAKNLLNKDIIDYIEFSSDYKIMELAIRPEWINNSIRNLNLRKKYEINIIAVKNQTFGTKVSPNPDYLIQKDDVIVAIVPNDAEKNMISK